MLVDILQQVTEPLSRADLAEILFNLIQPDCSRVHSKIEKIPYNQLKPILNEQYTRKFIYSLTEEEYQPSNITSLLIHLYQYSIVTRNERWTSVTLQPQVTINIDTDGKYIINYKTFQFFDIPSPVTYINDFAFISEPIEFINMPCYVDIPNDHVFIRDMEILYSPEKCDQYLAFMMMIGANVRDCGDAASSNNEQNRASTSSLSTRRSTQLAKTNKTATDVFSRAYWCGYYYYNTPSLAKKGYYTFDKQ